jgi:Putative Actinobacterial Holin-X, holin superfamily III
MAAGNQAGDEIGRMVGNLSETVSRLVRDELRLARSEMEEKARTAAPGAAMLAAAGGLGAGAFAVATAGVVRVAGRMLPRTLAPFAVAALYGGGATALAREGLRRLQEAGPPVPEQAMSSLGEDVRTATAAARGEEV